MIKTIKFKLLRSLFLPIFLMTMFLLPLLFILVKRYFSLELLPLSFFNSLILSGGMFLNIFIFIQLLDKIKIGYIYTLIVLSSAGFAITGLLYIIFNQPLFFLYGSEVLVSYILIIFIIITSLSLFSCAFFNYQKINEKEVKLREEMERQMYSSKINPHFLFNSLNLMVSLLDDKEKAEDILIQLSELLRYNLEASKKDKIPLTEEIDSVKKYLFIQKERFGKRLDFEITGESDSEIPPLLIQPIVENSIKHNLDRARYIKIKIDIKKIDNKLVIYIIDSEATLLESMIGLGTGLEVTKRRVELCNGKFNIINGGVEICLMA